jgi:Family of unknown function (DUF6399)
MGWWAKRVGMFNAMRAHGPQSLRRLAARTGLATRRVPRHRQALDRRDRAPESSLWETEAGRAWRLRLGGATLWVCGLPRGVGAATRRAFFSRRRVAAPVGGSPRAVRTVMPLLERLRRATAAAWEHDGMAQGAIRPVSGAVDDPCLPRRRWVGLALAPGAVGMAAGATERRGDTGCARANDRLQTLGTAGVSRGSDRAKAVIPLAHTGLGCPRLPAVVPLGPALAPGSARAICGRLRHAQRDRAHAQPRLETGPPHAQAAPPHVGQGQAQGAACAPAVTHGQGVGGAWRQRLAQGSRLRPPWRRFDATRPTAPAVEAPGRAALEASDTVLATNGLPRQKAPVAKVRQPRAGLAALVAGWWQTVPQDVPQSAMPPRWTPWADAWLWPRLSWHAPRRRTRCPGHKAPSVRVRQAVDAACARPPCTQTRTAAWRAGGHAGAAAPARAVPRASSAVAGRHGARAQRQHPHRGVPTRRYQGWTARHHVDGRATEGTTPASRCVRRSCPALCESVWSQSDEVPRPRQRRQALAARH